MNEHGSMDEEMVVQGVLFTHLPYIFFPMRDS